MVLTHVESDHGTLHIAYYETGAHKEGVIELQLSNPADASKIHSDDTVDIESLDDFFASQPCTVRLHHADHTIDTIQATVVEAC